LAVVLVIFGGLVMLLICAGNGNIGSAA